MAEFDPSRPRVCYLVAYFHPFESGAERQALAQMDHPNIARVLEAGETASGRPYFVMELVEGERVTAFCDANRLGMRERLELFIEICRAIHYQRPCSFAFLNIDVFREYVTKHGMEVSGWSPDGRLPEIMEIPDHPWFIGVQFHPELKSRPLEPHPLFTSFVAAAMKRSRLV